MLVSRPIDRLVVWEQRERFRIWHELRALKARGVDGFGELICGIHGWLVESMGGRGGTFSWLSAKRCAEEMGMEYAELCG